MNALRAAPVAVSRRVVLIHPERLFHAIGFAIRFREYTIRDAFRRAPLRVQEDEIVQCLGLRTGGILPGIPSAVRGYMILVRKEELREILISRLPLDMRMHSEHEIMSKGMCIQALVMPSLSLYFESRNLEDLDFLTTFYCVCLNIRLWFGLGQARLPSRSVSFFERYVFLAKELILASVILLLGAYIVLRFGFMT